MSWTAASLEVAAALGLGLAGTVVLRRHGGLSSIHELCSDQGDLRGALMHPTALAMLIGNVVIVTLSLAQL